MNPVPSNKVSIGVQTLVGYGLALASILTPVISAASGYSSVMHVPNYVFVIAATLLASITGYGRSNQAASLNQGTAIPATPPATANSSTIDPATLAAAQALIAAGVVTGATGPTGGAA